ncbi:LTA synthase family protein [Desulfosporosinus metallidurans]|uniref:Lipoteichoic acid synthase LtaS Type IVb n=1 Tax=Desulfosporosinus metallidurans TaxID=1888891 RepID=A0A1Q8QLW3_9FIRM|nr:LTA synthase family protein [Desulfosporosinus metallidurans]OLN28323.1 Lipoteichoic acid synthase LtaS Type IVb [Desulfosporosinus metallidurans]
MSRLDDDLAYNNSKLESANVIGHPTEAWRNLMGSGIVWLIDNMLVFFFTIAALLIKSVLFLGLINNDNATKFSFFKAFYSFSAPPPMLVYVSFSVIILSFAYLFKGRARFWFLVTCDFLFSLLLLADLMYYRGFSSFISPYLLSQTTNLDNLSSSIMSMLRPVDLLFFIDLLVIVGIGLKFKKFQAKTKRNAATMLILLALSISYIYFQHVQLDIKGKGEDMLFRVSWSPNQTMSNLSPLGYHAFDIYNFYENKQLEKLTSVEDQEIKSWFEQKQKSLPPNQYNSIFKGQNLIIIQVESLENFVINQKVNGQQITPNLNKLLANSLYFSNFYEQVYNGTSSDADLMTNTSVYPVRTGATFFRYPNNIYNSLPKLFRGLGYSTLAIHPDKGSYWNWMPALTAIGFEKTMDVSHFNADEKIGLGISDGSYLKQIAPIIGSEKQPFYNFIVTLTSHNPFDLPAQYRKLALSEELNQSKLGGYFQSINYTDEQIGNFLSTLDKGGVLENSVVVIYGDHTGVHKYYNDEVKQVQPQEGWWLDDSKRIPLIIYHKGMKAQEIKTTGGQIDTMPTVASLMGIDEKSYENTAFGRNLLDTNKDFVVLANKQYVGKASNKQEEEKQIQGIDLADLIIRKNYFKEKGFK